MVWKILQVKKLINKYHNGKGPYYIAEWYPGWFDSWGKPHAKVGANDAAKKLDDILSAGISINMYMFHGGTTRGFMNGANMSATEPMPRKQPVMIMMPRLMKPVTQPKSI
jgi:beta-galactosidase